ncbi:MAG: hypothetical protein SFY56_03495 [Bacteroidota bacterium]|nr:hypothetical protein [Bacteroidota bacterium]
MFKLLKYSILVFLFEFVSCDTAKVEIEENARINYDSLRRLDSMLKSIDISTIKETDDYFKQFIDTTFYSIKFQAWQSADELILTVNYLADTINGDTTATKYYYFETELYRNDKKLKTNFGNMLDYYNAYNNHYYLKTGKISVEIPIIKYNKSQNINLPIWHLQSDTLPSFDINLSCKLYYFERITNLGNKNLHELIDKNAKPILTLNTNVNLKNYNYNVKQLIIDSVELNDGRVYDFGLYGRPDLFYTLYTPYSTVTSNTDNQFTGGTSSINDICLFLRKPAGNLIMFLKDEDVLYHDNLEAIRFFYNKRDSSYHFTMDSSLYWPNLNQVNFTIKEYKNKSVKH